MNGWPTWATEEVRVQSPDEGWQRRGARLRRDLDSVLARWLAVPTQHVGSTSVPGRAAKPIIDVQAAVGDLGCADAVARALSHVDWHLVPADLDARPWRRFLVQVVDGHSTGPRTCTCCRPAARAWPSSRRSAMRYAPIRRSRAGTRS